MISVFFLTYIFTQTASIVTENVNGLLIISHLTERRRSNPDVISRATCMLRSHPIETTGN